MKREWSQDGEKFKNKKKKREREKERNAKGKGKVAREIYIMGERKGNGEKRSKKIWDVRNTHSIFLSETNAWKILLDPSY